MLQNATLSGNQRPDLLTSLMNMSLVLRLPRDMHLCRSSSNVPRLPSFLEMLQNPHVQLTFDKVHNPWRLPRETTSEPPKVVRTLGVLCAFWLRNLFRATTACTFSTSQLPKVVRPWCALYILTSKCASCHNGVHFFDISTSKSGPRIVSFLCILTSKCASHHKGVHFFDISTSKSGPTLVCFVHFDFEMCFAPQRRAFFISYLASWLRTRRFSEPTFRPSGATNHWKNSRLSCLFAHLHLLSSGSFSSIIFSLLLFSSLCLFPVSAFHLSILSEVWLLNFLRVMIIYYIIDYIYTILYSNLDNISAKTQQQIHCSASGLPNCWDVASSAAPSHNASAAPLQPVPPPGRPEHRAWKGRDSLIRIWGCRVSKWFHPACTIGVMFNYMLFNCYWLYSTFYTVHQTKYQTTIKHHQTSMKCYGYETTVFSPLNLPGSVDVWLDDWRLSSAQVRSSQWRMRRNQTYHRATGNWNGRHRPPCLPSIYAPPAPASYISIKCMRGRGGQAVKAGNGKRCREGLYNMIFSWMRHGGACLAPTPKMYSIGG